MSQFAPMAFLASRSPLGAWDHPLALLPEFSASHRCWQAEWASAVGTCHPGCAASFLLSLREASSFAPESRGAADGGDALFWLVYLDGSVRFFQRDSPISNKSSPFSQQLQAPGLLLSSAQIQLIPQSLCSCWYGVDGRHSVRHCHNFWHCTYPRAAILARDGTALKKGGVQNNYLNIADEALGHNLECDKNMVNKNRWKYAYTVKTAMLRALLHGTYYRAFRPSISL